MYKFLTILFFLIAVFGCTPKTEKKTPPTSPPTLSGKWQLEAIKFFPQDEIIVPSKPYWVQFEEVDGKPFLVFNKEVNTCRMSYFLPETGKIKLKNPAMCTKMCCDGDITPELTYSDVSTYDLQHDKLVLKASDRTFSFTKTQKNEL